MDGETEFPPASHELKEEIFYDEEYHWEICECGYTSEKADLVASNSKESLKSASTGDDTNVVFWVTLLIIGVGAATIVFRILYTIKKNRK